MSQDCEVFFVGKWVDICYCEKIPVWAAIVTDKKLSVGLCVEIIILHTRVYSAYMVMDRLPLNNKTVGYI